MVIKTLLVLLGIASRSNALPLEKVRALFVINPIAGTNSKSNIELLIEKKIDKEKIAYKIAYTEYPGHATEIACKAIQDGYGIVVAVGGDGTVNEIGKVLIGSGTALAIVPMGSGNGLARHLHIPMNHKKAITLINRLHKKRIDTVRINDTPYLGIAGMGFDAEVSHRFAAYGRRGLASYFRAAIDKFQSYKANSYDLIIDGNRTKKQAFLISFANTAQYGNNAYIAPDAHIDDGFLDLVILHEFQPRSIPRLSLELFGGMLGNSRHVERIPCKAVSVINPPSPLIHIDGEPITLKGSLSIRINPASLSVLTT